MVERSKKPSSREASSSRPGTSERELAVILESMRGEFRVFGVALQGQGNALQGFRLEVAAQFREVSARFDQLDGRLGRIDLDVDLLKTAVVENTRDIGLLKTAVVENTRELKHVGIAVDKK